MRGVAEKRNWPSVCPLVLSVLLVADYQIERELSILFCARVGIVRVCASIWLREFVGLPARLQFTAFFLLVFICFFHRNIFCLVCNEIW